MSLHVILPIRLNELSMLFGMKARSTMRLSKSGARNTCEHLIDIAADAEYIVSNDAHFEVLKSIDWPKVIVLKITDFYQFVAGS